uniref:Uncharacterized protein n=1 Tax=Cucumis melo TaxID=3656 RepID=A0A9I9EFY5_CUCME
MIGRKGFKCYGVPDVPLLSPLNDHLEGLIELGSNESLTTPHAVDSAIEKVGTTKIPLLYQLNSRYVYLFFSRRFVETR